MRYANVYEQIKKETAATAVMDAPKKEHWLRGPLLSCILPALFLGVFFGVRGQQKWMDFVVFRLTTPLKRFISPFVSALPFALGEVVWAVGVFALIFFLIRTIYLLITKNNRGKRLIRRGLALISAGLIIYSCYTVMWGVNYYAESFVSRAGMSPRQSSVNELTQLTFAFAKKCNELAIEMPRDEKGNVMLENDDLFCNAQQLYSGIAKEFPVLDVPVFDPKPMVFSKILSAMGFTGFYFPMTAESLVNVDQPDCYIPSTILHELAHQCNVAEEDAANFVAIMAGLRCDDPVFQYSSALMGYIHLGNALHDADREMWQVVYGSLNDSVLADLQENRDYWAKFESPVSDVSETIYEGYLKSVGHSEGMKSYGMCIDLLMFYYFDK